MMVRDGYDDGGAMTVDAMVLRSNAVVMTTIRLVAGGLRRSADECYATDRVTRWRYADTIMLATANDDPPYDSNAANATLDGGVDDK